MDGVMDLDGSTIDRINSHCHVSGLHLVAVPHVDYTELIVVVDWQSLWESNGDGQRLNFIVTSRFHLTSQMGTMKYLQFS
jgi:hypothetical protein